MPQFIDPGRFKAAARKGQAPRDVGLRKQLVSTIDPAGERRLRFTISTGSVDREKDVLVQGGWDLEAYRRNPVVLWQHDHDHLPIGRGLDLAIENDALVATVEFVPHDIPHVGEKASAVLQLCQLGFLQATSVGFLPLAWEEAEERDDGMSWYPPFNFTRMELLEFSIVTVPCNAEALLLLPDVLAPGPTGIPVSDPAADAARAAEQIALEKAAAAEGDRLGAASAARARRLHRYRLAETF